MGSCLLSRKRCTSLSWCGSRINFSHCQISQHGIWNQDIQYDGTYLLCNMGWGGFSQRSSLYTRIVGHSMVLFPQWQCPMFTCKTPWLGDVKGDCAYHAVGDTDSEHVFCALLNALRAWFQTLPFLPVLHDTLQSLCHEIVDYNQDETILNFLLTCWPHVLWVYSWLGSRPGSNVWNGLYYTVHEPPFQKCALQDLDYVGGLCASCRQKGLSCNNCNKAIDHWRKVGGNEARWIDTHWWRHTTQGCQGLLYPWVSWTWTGLQGTGGITIGRRFEEISIFEKEWVCRWRNII